MPRRLFVGLMVSDEVRAAMGGYRRALVPLCEGKLYDPALYHLTLCFVGMVDEERIPALERVMDGINWQSFALRLGEVGTFKGGSILWLGIESSCYPLMKIQAMLSLALRNAGFALDAEAYVPHITLGRGMKRLPVVMPDPPTGCWRVDRLTLFESVRLDGELCYRPIYEVMEG